MPDASEHTRPISPGFAPARCLHSSPFALEGTPMALTTWLSVMMLLGVVTLGVMALFVAFCDRV
jgi:hypothetical protein